MTDKEIIQALRCMATRDERRDCEIAKRSQLGCAECINSYIGGAAGAIERLTAENAKAEAERDAAIADLKISSGCASCKYHCSDTTFCCDCNKKQNCKCMSCSLGLANWKWRGLPEAQEEGEKA